MKTGTRLGGGGIGLVLMLAFMVGCSTTPVPRQYAVTVNRSGKSLNTEEPNVLGKETNYTAHLKAITDGIQSFAEERGDGGPTQVLIFIHGGLNTYGSSHKRAARLVPEILNDGKYPLFINWKSGLWNSYGEHLFLVRQGGENAALGIISSPFYFAIDLGRLGLRAPVVWFYQLQTDVKTFKDYGMPEWVRRWYGPEQAKYSQQLLDKDAKTDEIELFRGGDCRSGKHKFSTGLTYCLTLPVKLATGPFIDSMGRSSWDNMLRRTQTMFRQPVEVKAVEVERELEVARERVGKVSDAAIPQLMRELAKVTAGPGKNYEITIVAHSMGAIIANEILRVHPELPYKNIVYMGAACSVMDIHKSVVPALEANASAQFYNLTLHPVAEVLERNVWDLPPRGSLLEWIDNFFSTPRTMPERTMGKWENIIASTALVPEDVAGRVHIRAFGLKEPGDPQPEKHGDFNDYDFWKEEFWELPKELVDCPE